LLTGSIHARLSSVGNFRVQTCMCPNKLSVNGKAFPSLIDVTTEELAVGLESGQFTSVDLVNVQLLLVLLRYRLT